MENNEPQAYTQAITHAEFEAVAKQVSEIHAFLNGIANALNNPMLKAMLPPNMRAMIPGE